MRKLMLSAALAAAGLTPVTADAAKPAAKSAVKAETPMSEGQAAQPAPAGGYQYLRFVPKGYNADTTARWPVIIFLHGSGERGTDINLVKVHGPPKLVDNDPAFPFITLSPQLPAEDENWDPAKLDIMLDTAMRDLRIDPARVYLTGLSLGGMGTWDWGAARPDRFAAIAPVAARADLSSACKLKDTPIWVFHGDTDSVVPVSGDIDMAKAVEACGGKPRLTIYPATGHDSWTATYANAELYLWFLRQRKSISPQEQK